VGPYHGGGLLYGGTPPMGIWTKHPWRPLVPTWYLAPTSPTLNAHITKKSLPYLIYTIGTDLDAHVHVFQKVIQTNGEKNDADIINLFYFTIKDAISKWGENFMQSHPRCIFAKLEAAFYKRY
jgi:hypothetical protein